jgi:photosystem II stability/assembly factor-like uncharacterized protein
VSSSSSFRKARPTNRHGRGECFARVGRQTGTGNGLSEATLGEPVFFNVGDSNEYGVGILRLRLLTAALLALMTNGASCAETWQRLGPEGGMVVSLAAAGPDEVYLGSADGHVFASKDGAKSWELRGRVGNRLDAVVTRIVADPGPGQRLFAAVWYQEPGVGGGVFVSEDRGQTWRSSGLKTETVRALEIAPSEPAELVAGTRTGVFLSADSGKNWRRISPEGDEEIRNLDSLAIDPRDPQVIYAGTFHLPWLTRDGGKTWKAVSAGIIDDSDIMSMRLDTTNPDRVYMSACSGIYRSENQGGEWIKLQGIPYAARRTQIILQDPANPKTLYAGTTEGLWVTRDGGESWSQTTPKDWVVNSVVVLGAKNGASGRVVAGTEGRGIEVSDDAGVNFAEANRGFTHVIVKKLLADRRSPGHLLMIVERSTAEILESRDQGLRWSNVSLAAQDHRRKSITLDVGEVQDVLSSPWGWLLRFENGQLWLWDEDQRSWKEWRLFLPLSLRRSVHPAGGRAQPEAAQELKGVAVLGFSQNDAMVSSKEGLMLCRQSGICSLLPAFRSGPVHAAWISSPEGRTIAVVADDKLGLSSDGGKTAVWRDLPVAAEQVDWLDAGQSADRITLYLVTREGIFVSQESDESWQRLAGGLPAGQVERWLRAGVWAVAERGGRFYVSEDSGGSWKGVDQDSERSRMNGLVATPDGAVLAGSESEGLLRLDFGQKPPAGGAR